MTLLEMLATVAVLAAPAGADLPSNWRPLVDAELKASLKDPMSAIVELKRGPRYGDHKIDLQPRIGWAVCYSINAKNSYGSYTGAQTQLFIISPGGTVTWVTGDNLRSTYAAAVTRENVLKECARPADPAPAPENEKQSI